MAESLSSSSKQYILGRILSDRINNPEAYRAVIDELTQIQHDATRHGRFTAYFIPVESKRIQNRLGFRLSEDGLYHSLTPSVQSHTGLSAKEMVVTMLNHKGDQPAAVPENKSAPVMKSSGNIKDMMAGKYGRITLKATHTEEDLSARVVSTSKE